MDTYSLDGIMINPKERGSISYVKAKLAIEEAAKNRAEKRAAKQILIEHLKGKIVQESHKCVQFPDGSKARY
jgi:hypothetical protein